MAKTSQEEDVAVVLCQHFNENIGFWQMSQIDFLDRIYNTYVVVGRKTPGWAPGNHSRGVFLDEFHDDHKEGRICQLGDPKRKSLRWLPKCCS